MRSVRNLSMAAASLVAFLAVPVASARVGLQGFSARPQGPPLSRE